MKPVGFFVTHAKIFLRKGMKPELLKHAGEGIVPVLSDSRFINKEFFVDWLKHYEIYANQQKMILFSSQLTITCRTVISKLLHVTESTT